jgi:hypothetical protein
VIYWIFPCPYVLICSLSIEFYQGAISPLDIRTGSAFHKSYNHKDGSFIMKKFSYIMLIALLVAIPFVMGCEGSPSEEPSLPGGHLLGINLEPGDINLNAGYTVKFIATGIFPGGVNFDLTPYVSWVSSSPNIAYFLTDGTLVGSTPGTALISAKYGVTSSQTVAVTVPGASGPGTGNPEVPVLRSITVTPKFAAINEEGTQQFTCSGNFSDGHTEDYTNVVIWRISDPTLGFISSTGLFTSLAGGGVISVSAKYSVFESNYAVLTIHATP